MFNSRVNLELSYYRKQTRDAIIDRQVAPSEGFGVSTRFEMSAITTILSAAVATIFSWPGVGRLAVGAIQSRDLPLAQGAILVLAIAFCAINLIVDVAYAALDPRVQKR